MRPLSLAFKSFAVKWGSVRLGARRQLDVICDEQLLLFRFGQLAHCHYRDAVRQPMRHKEAVHRAIANLTGVLNVLEAEALIELARPRQAHTSEPVF